MKRLLLLVCLLGCSSQSDVSRNDETFKSGGVYLGTLPDGRQVRRYEVLFPGGWKYVEIVDCCCKEQK